MAFNSLILGCVHIEATRSRSVFSSCKKIVIKWYALLSQKDFCSFVNVCHFTSNIGSRGCLRILKNVNNISFSIFIKIILHNILFDIVSNITDSSTISSLMLGIFLNSFGSFSKIFSLIVVLKVDKTSSPDLNDDIMWLLRTFQSKIRPEIICGIIS